MPSEKTPSSEVLDKDALFNFLVGMTRSDVTNQALNDPGVWGQVYGQQVPGGPTTVDKREHAIASQAVAERAGAPASFLAGLLQEISTGIPGAAKGMGANIAAGQMPLTQTPALQEAAFGPSGFSINDLIANMRGIQAAQANGGIPQFLFGLGGKK